MIPSLQGAPNVLDRFPIFQDQKNSPKQYSATCPVGPSKFQNSSASKN